MPLRFPGEDEEEKRNQEENCEAAFRNGILLLIYSRRTEKITSTPSGEQRKSNSTARSSIKQDHVTAFSGISNPKNPTQVLLSLELR
ncbi:hypothetical protein TNCV_419251 [Trichonephila clavipes]|uniref:Uncharacterized protein n=1 Tax=Trichonephila clavipes TaxID=2585209 RepID=A0A8X6V9T4_TRICX|nr:hypothetical protein TNCV_419251 [Trichonephila clavipes]